MDSKLRQGWEKASHPCSFQREMVRENAQMGVNRLKLPPRVEVDIAGYLDMKKLQPLGG